MEVYEAAQAPLYVSAAGVISQNAIDAGDVYTPVMDAERKVVGYLD